MLDHLFKDNIDFGPPLMMGARCFIQRFTTNVTIGNSCDGYRFFGPLIVGNIIAGLFALTLTARLGRDELSSSVCDGGMLEFLLFFLVCRSRKIDRINSIIMSMLFISILSSGATLPAALKVSKSAFRRLTSSRTDVLSKFANGEYLH